MGCFRKLVTSHFLANVSTELELARRTLKSMSQSIFPPFYYASPKDRKDVYDTFVYQHFLLEEISESIVTEGLDKDMIYYFGIDEIVYIYNASKSQINDAITYSFNVNGDIPYHRGKHRLQGHTIHTVLIDTRMGFSPASPN